jgi:dTDP-4-dehydrorhamnose 3,5-epimerase
MVIEKTIIEGLFLIKPTIFEDIRGWFIESYNREQFSINGIECDFIQDNHSLSLKRGTLRGLHMQIYPKQQSKLVRCTRGKILDVVVDLRRNSKTYLQKYSVELSGENKIQILIPKGLAHGFVTLEDLTEVQYKVDQSYSKSHEISIRHDDPTIGIDWKVENPILSIKDLNGIWLRDLIGYEENENQIKGEQ